MAEILGIINFENDAVKIAGLDEFRTIPALSFLGRYRIIDFVLSNMVNSNLHQVKILVKDKPRSLIEHIDRASQYNINSKRGSLQILYTDQAMVNDLYFTDIALMRQYRTSIEEMNCGYVIIAPSYMICRIDYQKVLKQHIASKADITCVYKQTDGKDFAGCQSIIVDNDRVYGVRPTQDGNEKISMQTYIMSKQMFLKVIDDANDASPLYNLNEYLKISCSRYHIGAYEYTGYLQCINSMQKYFDVHMSLIHHENAKELFSNEWPIYTKTNDSPPAFYTRSACVKNSLIANGCVVHGTLENCILGRGVIVEKGAVVKNAILLPNCHIGPDADISYAIIDKHAKVENIKEIHGSEKNVAYVRRRDIV